MPQKVKSETAGQKYTNPSRKGDIAEQFVVTEALRRGAEVFKNVCATGDADLVLIHNGIIVQIDVKLMRYQKSGDAWGSYAGKPLDHIYYVLVNPETYEIRWMKRKKPAGLEDFWDEASH